MRDGFERRFSSLMNPQDSESHPLYIAMITNPEFKLNYMGSAQIDPRVCAQLKLQWPSKPKKRWKFKPMNRIAAKVSRHV